MPGVLRRLTDRLTRSESQRDADELLEQVRSSGARSIGELADREIATVTGAVRAVTLRPRSSVPALVVEIFDGSQTLVLVWLGRRQIRGIEPGAYLRATGRVCRREGVPTIFNPSYELRPRPGITAQP